MALSIFDDGENLVLVDETGKALQRTPKAGLSQSRLNAIKSYPAVDASRYDSRAGDPMSPGYFSPEAVSSKPQIPTVAPMEKPTSPVVKESAYDRLRKYSESLRSPLQSTMTQAPAQSLPMEGSASSGGLESQASKAFDKMIAGRSELSEIEAKEAAATASALDEQEKEAANFLKGYEATQKEADDAGQNAIKSYEDSINSLMNSNIDPNRFYSSRTTSQRVMLSVGLLLSGLADAAQVYAGRGPANHVERFQKIVNEAIDRDISAQEMDQRKSTYAAGLRQNLYSLYRAKFSDKKEALLATKAAMLESFERKVKGIALNSSSEKAKANAEIAAGTLESEKVKVLDMLRNSAASRRAEEAKAVLEASKAGQETNKLWVEGWGMAPTEEDAKKGKEARIAFETMKRNLDRLEEIRLGTIRGKKSTNPDSNYGFEVLNRDIVNEAQGRAAEFLTAYNTAKSLGALDQGTIKIIDRMIPSDPTKLGFVGAQIRTVQKMMDEQETAFKTTRGFQKVATPVNAFPSAKRVR